MDYVFACAMRSLAVSILVVSYDIACQWFINLRKRITSDWPTELHPPKTTNLIPAIPKLHEPMHKKADHQGFSFNFIPGVGLTDGEAPERIWAPHNALASATRQQAPGSRQDVLDAHFGFWNWLKYIGQGDTLLRRYKAAVADRNLQRRHIGGLQIHWMIRILRNGRKCAESGKSSHIRRQRRIHTRQRTPVSRAHSGTSLSDHFLSDVRIGGQEDPRAG